MKVLVALTALVLAVAYDNAIWGGDVTYSDYPTITNGTPEYDDYSYPDTPDYGWDTKEGMWTPNASNN